MNVSLGFVMNEGNVLVDYEWMNVMCLVTVMFWVWWMNAKVW